jgi:hypothetical protein
VKPTTAQRLRYRLWSAPTSPRGLDRALLLLGSFKQVGWFESGNGRGPVDAGGNPLPWYTYPAIYWLESILTGSERVFEYGSGNSTRWFASRVQSVVAVEHDESWANRVRPLVPHNVELHFVPLSASDVPEKRSATYVSAIAAQQQGGFDIVVVDGEARNACCQAALPYLQHNGLLILDNSDWPEFEPANTLLLEQGFGRMDFIGPVPGNVGWSSTSVYARDFLAWTRRTKLPTAHTKKVRHFGGPRSH